MRFVKQSTIILESKGSLKDIERAARVCYKSEDRISEDNSSAEKLVEFLYKKEHYAMAEFGDDWYFKLTPTLWTEFCLEYAPTNFAAFKALDFAISNKHFFVRINPRALKELKIYNNDRVFTDIPEEIQTATVHIITNRGISHELVRHRHCSFAQESTRYCRYNKDKFNGVTYVIPEWLQLDNFVEYKHIDIRMISQFVRTIDGNSQEADFLYACIDNETDYLHALKNNETAQQARGKLNTDVKTELIMKATLREWKHIFKLRCDKAAHPQMRELIIPLKEEFIKKYPYYFNNEN